MLNEKIQEAFATLSTPLIADACIRLKLPILAASVGIQAIDPTMRLAGHALPAQHYGSVDIFLEAFTHAEPGDVLVIDDARREHQSCIGDLTALEAEANQIAGIIIWGLHRDTPELLKIALPVFSYGSTPAGPVKLLPRAETALDFAQFGKHRITHNHVVFADLDGVLFVDSEQIEDILSIAQNIRDIEKRQAHAVEEGNTLYEQLQFATYMEKRDSDPSYSFRRHLRAIGGAIEE